MTVGALVLAAGMGVRLGPGVPKGLRLLRGEPLLLHAVRSLQASPEVGQVVVAAPPQALGEVEGLLRDFGVTVVPGGSTRQRSVAVGLRALVPEVDLVLVHDAARCLTPAEVVARVVAALRAGAPAVVPVLPVVDTVKEVAEVDGAEAVLATVDRSRLRSAQTPQGFRRDVLERAHASADIEVEAATDDAGMVERSGTRVVTVAGSPEAFKVTTPLDLLLAEAVLTRRVEAVLARRAQVPARHPASLEARP